MYEYIVYYYLDQEAQKNIFLNFSIADKTFQLTTDLLIKLPMSTPLRDYLCFTCELMQPLLLQFYE